MADTVGKIVQLSGSEKRATFKILAPCPDCAAWQALVARCVPLLDYLVALLDKASLHNPEVFEAGQLLSDIRAKGGT